jgi:predicted MFS family arabinose efflux permease
MAMLIYMLVVGATFAAYGLYVLPVSAEFKLSRADINTGVILMNLGQALLAPFIGRLLDKVPVRGVLITGALVFGASFFVLSRSHSLWLSALVLALPVPAAYLTGSLSSSLLLARWFVAQRGRAMALAGLGISMGQMIIAPLIGWLIEQYGWRTAVLISGGGLTAFLLPLTLLVRPWPGPQDVEPGRDRAAAQANEAERAPAKVGGILRGHTFWFLSLGTAIGCAVSQTLVVTIVPLARESGFSAMEAATLLSVMGGGAIAGSLLLAVIADKVDRVLLQTGMLISGAIINAILMSGPGYQVMLGCAAWLGITNGVITPTFYALLADRFGPASFGTVRGLSFPVLAVMSMIAVRFAGEVFDRTGGYTLMFQTMIVFGLIAAGLILALRFTGRATAPVKAAPSA